MRTDELLVLLRGVLLERHATPVVLRATGDEPTATVDVPDDDDPRRPVRSRCPTHGTKRPAGPPPGQASLRVASRW